MLLQRIGNACSVPKWGDRLWPSHNAAVHLAVVQPELTVAAQWLIKAQQTGIKFQINRFKGRGTTSLTLIQSTPK